MNFPITLKAKTDFVLQDADIFRGDLIEVDREKLIQILSEDFANSSDTDERYDIAYDGFKGFIKFSNKELLEWSYTNLFEREKLFESKGKD